MRSALAGAEHSPFPDGTRSSASRQALELFPDELHVSRRRILQQSRHLSVTTFVAISMLAEGLSFHFSSNEASPAGAGLHETSIFYIATAEAALLPNVHGLIGCLSAQALHVGAAFPHEIVK